MNGTEIQTDTEPVRTEVMKPHANWKDSHIVLFVLPVVLTMLFPVGGLFYLLGRFSPIGLDFCAIWMIYPLVVIFMAWCLYTGIVKLLITKGNRTGGEKLVAIAETGVALIFFGLLSPPIFFGLKLGVPPIAVGLRHRVESQVDIAATRIWLQSLDAELGEYTEGGVVYVRSSKWLSRSELPESLRGLGAGARLSADENGNPRIAFGWGGTPSGHWGIVIGMEDMTIPESEFSPEVRHVVPVEPGVYVWWGE